MNDVRDTCRGEECYWWQLTDGKCPNYHESWWTKPGEEPKLVKDCAHIRIFMMLQDLSNRLVALQSTNEEQRNQSFALLGTIAQVMTEKNKALEAKPTPKLIVEYKDEVD